MTGAIILAAGASSRFGEPKQKKVFEGQSLLLRTVQTALISNCETIIVVLGAFAGEIQADIEKENVMICHNSEWEEGMASSIRSGVEAIQKIQPSISDVILMICDQPFVDVNLLNSMINKKAITGKGIIACSYNNTLGVPVLFGVEFFPELLRLEGQEGAKKIIMKHQESVAHIPFPLGSFDIDTNDDYETLITSRT